MKDTSLEPGLLSVFWLFAGLRLGLLLLWLGLVFLLRRTWPAFTAPVEIAIIQSGLLVGYLSWPWLRGRLGRAFLPVGLLLASAGPILEQHLVWLRLEGPLVGPLVGGWRLIPILFIPLVLIGWQYQFRHVLFFCLATAALDLGLIGLYLGPNEPLMLSILGLVFGRTLSYGLVGYLVVRLMATQRAQRQALAQANSRLARYATTLEQLATSRERNRLARELHDTLAHTLSGVAVQLEAVKTVWASQPDQAQALLDQSLVTTRTGLTETRRALLALRASPLDDLGPALAVRQLAETMAAKAGLVLSWQGPAAGALEGLDPEVEQCLYRVTQEALDNITRHALARQVSVQLEQTERGLRLQIGDDGLGFDPARVEAACFGLKGMRERAEMIGGRLEIKSQPGEGTLVCLTVEEKL